jgi:hypothetical protein
MKSSHSGTPILSPAFEAISVFGVAMDFSPVLMFELLLLVVSVLEQPIKTMANAKDRISKVVLRMKCSSDELLGLKSAQIIHADAKIL